MPQNFIVLTPRQGTRLKARALRVVNALTELIKQVDVLFADADMPAPRRKPGRKPGPKPGSKRKAKAAAPDVAALTA